MKYSDNNGGNCDIGNIILSVIQKENIRCTKNWQTKFQHFSHFYLKNKEKFIIITILFNYNL